MVFTFHTILLWKFAQPSSIIIFILTLEQICVPFPTPFAFPPLPLILGFLCLSAHFTLSLLFLTLPPELCLFTKLCLQVACHVPSTFLTRSQAFSSAHHRQPMYLLPSPFILNPSCSIHPFSEDTARNSNTENISNQNENESQRKCPHFPFSWLWGNIWCRSTSVLSHLVYTVRETKRLDSWLCHLLSG